MFNFLTKKKQKKAEKFLRDQAAAKEMQEMFDTIQENIRLKEELKANIIKTAKLDHCTTFPALISRGSNSQVAKDAISKALIDCIKSHEITAINNLLHVISNLRVDIPKEYIYEGIKTGDIETVNALLFHFPLDQEAFNIAMEEGEDIRERIKYIDKVRCDGKFSENFNLTHPDNKISLEEKNETDVMGDFIGDLGNHPE